MVTTEAYNDPLKKMEAVNGKKRRKNTGDQNEQIQARIIGSG